jgi:phage baseplate assembly protein W
MSFFGPSWPLQNGTEDVFKMNKDLKSQINFELKNLLLTAPGENISDRNYGINIRRYLFEQNIDSTNQLIASSITEQVSKYLNYIILRNIEVSNYDNDADSLALSVSITYSIPRSVEQEVFRLNINTETTVGFF